VERKDLAGVQGERTFFVGDGTEVSAVRAGDFGREIRGALFEEGSAGALGEPGGGGRGQFFHGLEIEGGIRAGIAARVGRQFCPTRQRTHGFLGAFPESVGDWACCVLPSTSGKCFRGFPLSVLAQGSLPCKVGRGLANLPAVYYHLDFPSTNGYIVGPSSDHGSRVGRGTCATGLRHRIFPGMNRPM
jgi:hypothetical protein